MLYRVSDGSVSLGGKTILSHIDFEIRGNEKIAVVGKNGSGKTTLLKLIAGELALDSDDKRQGPGIFVSRNVTVGMLRQQGALCGERTVEEELLAACPAGDLFSRERYEYEMEYDRIFTGFGFRREDKKKRLSEFSGGERTKIALIRLLLEKPDLLLLDEPTNHLDLQTVEWLEQYLRGYDRAVVMVSHDRFFLDRTAEAVWELEGGKLTRYAGGYTHYRQEKRKRAERQMAAYKRQQEEILRQEELIKRFKNKPRKAAFARSRKKMLERMERIEKPEFEERGMRPAEIVPAVLGSKWVLEAEHLKIGYDRPLLELSLRVRRGQKIGIIGDNGVGKSTFLKTAAGFVPPLKGELAIGNQVTIGYFDQQSAEVESDKTVLEHFHDLFPSMSEKEVRSTLGGYLFGGREAAKTVSSLSGGEKSRLLLAELLESRPNFLILDEPTNHMDIQAKEVLEEFFKAYQGTLLVVSHDRYFVDQVAESLLIFEGGAAMYYPFGYGHYLERREREASGEPLSVRMKAEEQALIAGLKAVPKAERHRLREIPTEEAYKDWRLRLAGERLEAAAGEVERLYEEMDAQRRSLVESEAYWREVTGADGDDTAAWVTDAAGGDDGAARELDDVAAGAASAAVSSAGLDTVDDDDAGYGEAVRVDSASAGPDAPASRLAAAEQVWLERCLEWYEIYEGDF